ncbi:hypothetical protein [Paenibacillus sp. NFR01]|uniref:hypothetical protein n=1 Tax=Paenibacillus sp. NFR01 TaxID=1566279 RepID=UPI0008C6549B|nr:hypothetical protein [Paenibacillus sp. NFR01]SES95224.1 hypothetical protein SAMN03159358_0378 [Paenibacillus sp. NFR01]
MGRISYVQQEAAAYYRHIPAVPEFFAIHPDLKDWMAEDRWIAAFRKFSGVMGEIYRDIEIRPEAYGLPVVPVDEDRPSGEKAKHSWRAIKRIGDVIREIGRLGVASPNSLDIPAAELKAALKKIPKAALILMRLTDFGFVLRGLDHTGIGKGTEWIHIGYPAHPDLLAVLEAYALAEPYHPDDPHEFYYFDYKRLADRSLLPRDCVVRDLAAMTGGDAGLLLAGLHRHLTESLGLAYIYKDDGLEYVLHKKRVARIMIDFHRLEVQVVLKLKSMDRYMETIAALPAELKRYFEQDGCHYCSFQKATREYCKYRLHWCLEGENHVTCSFETFLFDRPSSGQAEALAELVRLEYAL